MHVPVQPGILESVPGLREFPDLSGHGVQAPSTFRHTRGASGHGKDLTSYEDGPGSPNGDTALEAGLMFVAFGRSHAAFEVQMRRMAGQEDGVTDAMFRICKPVTGACLWCPPVRDGRFDRRQLEL